MSDYKYKFSIVMAVYNAELFLREAIESITKQTIGIKNVQFILVNDGSADNSGSICDEYSKKYPENIQVIHKQNGGVSSARNTALQYIQGKYVNFLDADDKLELSALKKAWRFFEKHYSETDIVAMPIKFFDAARGNHMLNFKFNKGSRVANLKNERNMIQMSSSSAFIKAECLKNISFDETLAYAEDAKVVQTILMEKQTLGLLSNTAYYYRKRNTGDSAIQNSGQKANWYLPVLNNYHLYLVEKYLNRFGEVSQFAQYALMYDLQWRIKKPEILALSDEEKADYVQKLKQVLKHISDDIIMEQSHMEKDHKLFALEMKYSNPPELTCEDEPSFVFSKDFAFPLSNCAATLDNIDISENTLSVDASVQLYNREYKNTEFYFLVNGEKVASQKNIDGGEKIALEKAISVKKRFSADISIASLPCKILLGANINGYDVVFKSVSLGKFAPLSNKYRANYYNKNKRTLFVSGNTLVVSKRNVITTLKKEIRLWLQLFKRDRLLGVGAIALRTLLFTYKLFKRKPIWIISDRIAKAGDNGEALFKYLCENHKEIDARFVVRKSSADYNRLKKFGKVLSTDSLEHKLLSAVSDFIISSHAEPEVFCPLRSRVEAFKGWWVKNKFVFLQHGVTKDDLSDWLNKYNKNLSGFVVSAYGEYNSILEYDYYYTENEAWLTGMPRFDFLYNNAKKIITISPTWRKYLTTKLNPSTGKWGIAEDFCESEFFKFYNSLINSPKLISAAKKYGYTLEFVLHPNLYAAENLFYNDNGVKIISNDIDYNAMFAKSDLIVTDYSSTVFDFVYLRKPVVYTQFDSDRFFAGEHSYQKGYFDYERDGFGEVEYDLESAVDRIVEYIENGCALKPKYRERIDNFFAFDDKNNCKRVYEKIMELAKKN